MIFISYPIQLIWLLILEIWEDFMLLLLKSENSMLSILRRFIWRANYKRSDWERRGNEVIQLQYTCNLNYWMQSIGILFIKYSKVRPNNNNKLQMNCTIHMYTFYSFPRDEAYTKHAICSFLFTFCTISSCTRQSDSIQPRSTEKGTKKKENKGRCYQ